MTIHDRIRERRLELGLSQSALAKKIGMSSGAIANYESGTRKPKNTLELASALRVSRDWLETGKEKSFPILGSIDTQEIKLLNAFRVLDSQKSRADVIKYIEFQINIQKNS